MDKWQMRPSIFGKPGVSAAVRILQISKQLRQNPALGYATAFVSVGAASGLQWLAQDEYAGSPFLTIYPAVIVNALVGGTGAGFLAAALAGVSQYWLFIPTFHWLAFLSYAFDASVCVMLIDFPLRLTQPASRLKTTLRAVRLRPCSTAKRTSPSRARRCCTIGSSITPARKASVTPSQRDRPATLSPARPRESGTQ
jgi:hypothetical protein